MAEIRNYVKEVAIGSIAVLGVSSMLLGYNGQVLAMIIGIIGGITGYAVAKK